MAFIAPIVSMGGVIAAVTSANRNHRKQATQRLTEAEAARVARCDYDNGEAQRIRDKANLDRLIEKVGDEKAHCKCGKYYSSWTAYSKGAGDISQSKFDCYCKSCGTQEKVWGYFDTASMFKITLFRDGEEKKIDVIAPDAEDAFCLALAYEDNAKNGWSDTKE